MREELTAKFEMPTAMNFGEPDSDYRSPVFSDARAYHSVTDQHFEISCKQHTPNCCCVSMPSSG